MADFAITFPGQGSQSVGMLSELAALHPVIRETFEEGSDTLGLDLWALSQKGPAEALNETRNTQPVMLCSGVAVQRLLSQQSSMRPAVMAGHSLGEYAALVAAGVMSLGDGTRLVAERGRLMQQAVPAGTGAMAAVLGLDDAAVLAACSKATQGQVVEAVNFNSPGQVVIAGHAEAVERAVALAREAGARRAVLLDVSVPSHCALMRPAAEHLAAAIRAIELAPPQTPVLHNTSVEEARDAESIAEALVAQLYSPVRWVETVMAIGARGVTSIVEAGPGKVLTGLAKRIDKSMTGLPVLDPATLDQALEAIHA